MRTWTVGGQTVEVREPGDAPIGVCAVADCAADAVWRSTKAGGRCAEHAEAASHA